MKLLSVVGARPNFMKIAPILAELKKFPHIEHCLVHSGQHYDRQLSDQFFSDLNLPQPDINLHVGSASHAVQTAEIMQRIEPVLIDRKPDMILVVGDVNSTLAAALTAAKLGIPIAHIEAGLRSFDMVMPEEINRKLTDAISSLLFVTEQSGVENLLREGVTGEKIFLVGNVMIDCLLQHRGRAGQSKILTQLGVRDVIGACSPYGVLTLHRPSNVESAKALEPILLAVKQISSELPIFFPLHPRTHKSIADFGLMSYFSAPSATNPSGIVPIDPLGYLDFLCLNDNARMVLTDSGGVQEETTALGVPCLTLRSNTERPATVEQGSNQVVGTDPERITAAAMQVLQGPTRIARRPPLWDGRAASRLVAVLCEKTAQSFSA